MAGSGEQRVRAVLHAALAYSSSLWEAVGESLIDCAATHGGAGGGGGAGPAVAGPGPRPALAGGGQHRWPAVPQLPDKRGRAEQPVLSSLPDEALLGTFKTPKCVIMLGLVCGFGCELGRKMYWDYRSIPRPGQAEC